MIHLITAVDGWLLFCQKRLSVVQKNHRTRSAWNFHIAVNQYDGNLWFLIYSFVIRFILRLAFLSWQHVSSNCCKYKSAFISSVVNGGIKRDFETSSKIFPQATLTIVTIYRIFISLPELNRSSNFG